MNTKNKVYINASLDFILYLHIFPNFKYFNKFPTEISLFSLNLEYILGNLDNLKSLLKEPTELSLLQKI